MSDKELLELAAKAAGYVLHREWDSAIDGILLGNGSYDDPFVGWDPLNYDGDALRLAVSLHLLGEYEVQVCSMVEPDPCAATRRAIVRAAAEIGKQS